jgi:hypothetical protein
MSTKLTILSAMKQIAWGVALPLAAGSFVKACENVPA